MKSLTKCVIPAAGRGTRLLPLTERQPKEMIEVGGKPLIEWAVEEALDTGLTDICLISRPGKRVMESHLMKLLNEKYRPEISFCCIEQKEPRGLGRAIALAKDFAGEEPFVLILPDNLVRAREPVIRQMIPAFKNYGLSINALMKFSSPHQAVRFSNSGRVDIERLAGAVFKIKNIYPKGKGAFPWRAKEKNFRLYPRSILLPEFFSYLEELSPPFPREFDDVPVFQKMAEEGRLLGYDTRAEVFDAGNPKGLRHTRLYFTTSEFK